MNANRLPGLLQALESTEALGVSAVRGVVGAYASATTYTLSSAALIAFYRPTDKVIEHVATSQGSLTCDIGTQGRDGRDQAGTFTASTPVYLYYTWDGSTVATRMSASAPPTGPTLANGETSWAFVGAFLLNGSSQFLGSTRIRGNVVTYDTVQQEFSGAPPSSFTAVDVSSSVPPEGVAPLIIGCYQMACTHGATGATMALRGLLSTVSNGTHATIEWQGASPTLTGGTNPQMSGTFTILNKGQQIWHRESNAGTGISASVNIMEISGYTLVNGG